MIVAKPTMVDLLRLAASARPDEIAQYESLLGRAWNVDDVANDHYNRGGVKFALIDPATDIAVVAGGYEMIGPQVWQSWMIGTMDAWGKHWFKITRETRRVMDALFDSGARRLQTCAVASRTEACDWYMRGLGMQPEGTMRGYGINGEDVAMFSKLKKG
jgi:hypothetical protein